jgi:Putative beta-lactamase-inhibitor-like, PepSY-like
MMKRNLLLSILFCVAVAATAQEKSVTAPAAAKAAFEKDFPGSAKVKWEKEKQDYEVNFTRQGKEMSALYDNKGLLKETEEAIKIQALPAGIADYIKQHYKGASIKEAAKITKPGGTLNYEAEVNKKDLIFNAAGRFIKEQQDED